MQWNVGIDELIPQVLRTPEAPEPGLAHMGINLTVVALYVVNFWMRMGAPDKPGNLVWLSLVSILLLVVSGWLGGKMVYEYGVAVNKEDTHGTSR